MVLFFTGKLALRARSATPPRSTVFVSPRRGSSPGSPPPPVRKCTGEGGQGQGTSNPTYCDTSEQQSEMVAGSVDARRKFTDMLTADAEVVSSLSADGPGGGHEDLVSFIGDDVVGAGASIKTAFGDRRVTFADWTASGKALGCIEKYIVGEVLPLYANTHTTSSATGSQTTLFRAEARGIIRRCVGGDSKKDTVIFTGTGSTGAVNHLVHMLKHSAEWRSGQPLVIAGPYEHHSNILPWREAGAVVSFVGEADGGGVDMAHLEEVLRASKGRHKLVIGAFSAASNLTGVLVDTDRISMAIHRYGGLAFFDYASAGPYVAVDMNPKGVGEGAHKDGVFLSPHKFVGGVGTPGVLAVKKSLVQGKGGLQSSRPPMLPGGGTVFFVTEEHHRYLDNLEEREEGGTPDIVGAIRCGLAFRVKEAVGTELIQRLERAHWDTVTSKWGDCDAIQLLGPATACPKLTVAAFMIRHTTPEGKDLYLHHNYVAALLNDLFGIQARSGCMCAGPYALRLLGIEGWLSREYEEVLLQGDELIRPGFVRLSVNYFSSELAASFVGDAVRFIADNGWKLLPAYTFLPETGEWRHRSCKKNPTVERKWLSEINFSDGDVSWKGSGSGGVKAGKRLTKDEAERYMAAAEKAVELVEVAVREGGEAGGGVAKEGGAGEGASSALATEQGRMLRWFLLPSEAAAQIKAGEPPLDWVGANPFVPPGGQGNWLGAGLLADGGFEAFAMERRKGLEERLPYASFQELLRISGEAWRHLTLSEREAYSAKAREAAANGSEVIASEGDTSIEPEDEHQQGSIDLSNGAQQKKPVLEMTARSPTKGPVAAGTAGAAPGAKEAPQQPQNVCERKPRNQQQLKKEGAGGETDKVALKKAEKKLCSLTGKCILDFGMIKDGDRVLVGLSGGKDSLSLLHILMLLQKKAPIKFEIGACTVDPQTPEFDPRPLIAYLASLGVPYFYESQGIMEQAACSMDKKNSICSFCSRMKRGVLYTVCKREGYTTLALGQHLDDQAESLLMSCFHNGQLRTMKCHYRAKEHEVRIIRPLNYVRETLTRQYAILKGLPVIDENCPGCFEQPKERARIKVLLASQEQVFPDLYGRLLRAMMPLMAAECVDQDAPAVRDLYLNAKDGESSIISVLAGKRGGKGGVVEGSEGDKGVESADKLNGGSSLAQGGGGVVGGHSGTTDRSSIGVPADGGGVPLNGAGSGPVLMSALCGFAAGASLCALIAVMRSK